MRRILGALGCALWASCAHRPINAEADGHVALGYAYYDRGQCDQAEAQCRLALEFGRDHPPSLVCMGLVELYCHNDVDAAKQRFKDAVAIDEDFAPAQLNLGVTLLLETPP